MTQTLFHGTIRDGLVGKIILPASRTGVKPLYVAETDPTYAYATKEESTGWHWAEKAWNCADKGIPRVYEVAPVDPRDVEQDPTTYDDGRSRGNFDGDRRPHKGFHVIREVPMPDSMGNPDDWR